MCIFNDQNAINQSENLLMTILQNIVECRLESLVFVSATKAGAGNVSPNQTGPPR